MEHFQNNTLSATELPDFENIELTPISPKYLNVVLLNNAVASVMLFIAAGVGYYFLLKTFQMQAWIYFGSLIVLFLLNFVYQYFAFFKRKYAIRERDVVYHYGLLQSNTVIYPFNRIQHSALEEGWISRILGLKSVHVYTAGAGADLTIHGLPREVAENFNQLITNKIKDEEYPAPDPSKNSTSDAIEPSADGI